MHFSIVPCGSRCTKQVNCIFACLARKVSIIIKANDAGFTAAGWLCRHNLRYENFTSSFGRLRQKIASKRLPHVQHDHISSFNQSNHQFVALSLPLTSSFLNSLVEDSAEIFKRSSVGAADEQLKEIKSYAEKNRERFTENSLYRPIKGEAAIYMILHLSPFAERFVTGNRNALKFTSTSEKLFR